MGNDAKTCLQEVRRRKGGQAAMSRQVRGQSKGAG